MFLNKLIMKSTGACSDSAGEQAAPDEIQSQSVCIDADIGEVLDALCCDM